LKGNIILKGIVPLEILFDVNIAAFKPANKEHEEDIKDCNIGIEQQPKLINFSNGIPEGYK